MSKYVRPPRRGRRVILFAFSGALWTLFALYPNAAVLTRNLARYRRLPVDPELEQKMGWELPAAPATIELFVDSLHLKRPDWPLFRVPWYVPTPLEAALMTHGDCEAKTLVFASILEGKGLPYDIRASFTHIWVDYPGRSARVGESPEVAYMVGEPERLSLRWPDRIDWRQSLAVQREALWEAMPLARKFIWLLGLSWVALAAVLVGGGSPTGDLVSQWRVRPAAYVGRAALIAIAVFGLIAVVSHLRSDRGSAAWILADLYEVAALSAVAGAFLAWLAVLSPRRAVNFEAEHARMHTLWRFGILGGSSVLAADHISQFELIASRNAISGWTICASLCSGRRVALLTHHREVAARAALRRLGSALERPMVVRAHENDYWTAADEIGLSLRERAARRPKSDLAAPPDDMHLSVEEGDSGWSIGYPPRQAGAARTLLAIAGIAGGGAVLGTAFVALLSRNIGAWLIWATATVLLGMTIYAASCLREEILAWLVGSRVKVGDGELSFRRADGKVESVAVDTIESVELARLGDSATIAVVAPERVIHVRLYCAPKHRQWVRHAIERAVAEA